MVNLWGLSCMTAKYLELPPTKMKVLGGRAKAFLNLAKSGVFIMVSVVGTEHIGMEGMWHFVFK